MLALHDREVVSVSRLVDVVWGAAAPPTATNSLQVHVSYLRGVLGNKAAIRAHPPGYVFDLGAESTDVQVVERLLRQGMQSDDPAYRVRQLAAALALWRGQALADLADLSGLEDQARRLDLLCLEVRRTLSEARLAAGEHTQLVPGLEQMAAEHPLDLRIHAQLMLALYRSGRQADALAVYRRLRQTLGDQLGIDPSQQLRDLETAILQQDPALDAPDARPAAVPLSSPPVPVATVPAQLPSAVPSFAGRERGELAYDFAAVRRGQWGAGRCVVHHASFTAVPMRQPDHGSRRRFDLRGLAALKLT
jgi:DNA-binding SARP family transcriptional activator